MKKPKDKKAEKDSTRESVENGRKAIDQNLELEKKNDPKAIDKEKKDAEVWRNEG